MDNDIKIRKLPRKTIIILITISILAAFVYYLTQEEKKSKVTAILSQVGYKNVSNVKVYGATKVEDKDTKIQGFRYFVIFNNVETNQECRGFVVKDFKRKYKKDITCKGNK